MTIGIIRICIMGGRHEEPHVAERFASSQAFS